METRKTFRVNVPVLGNCEAIIRAVDEDEAVNKAQNLEPSELHDLAGSVQVDIAGVHVLEEIHDGLLETMDISGPPEQDDIYEKYFDKALTALNKILAPLTLRYEVGEITEMMLRHISTHMDTELCAIHNGPEDDSWHELSKENQAIHYKLQRKGREKPKASNINIDVT